MGGPEARESYWLLLALLLGLMELNLSNESIQPVVNSEQHQVLCVKPSHPSLPYLYLSLFGTNAKGS